MGFETDSEERFGETIGITLNPGNRREGHAGGRDSELVYRQNSERTAPSIQSDECVRYPKTTWENDIVKVPRHEADEVVTGDHPHKLKRRHRHGSDTPYHAIPL